MNKPHLTDKLRERLAVERTGAELYGVALALASEGGDLVAHLRRFRDEKRANVTFLEVTIRELGGDPDARSSSIVLAEREASGLLDVVRSPDAELAHALHALLAAALVDIAGWELIVELIGGAGMDLDGYRRALSSEKEHARFVRARLAEIERRETAVNSP